MLLDIAKRLQSVGLCQQAVDSYIKAGDVKKAVDCCVLLNEWNLAVQLAEQYNFVQIEGLLAKYATHLLEKGKKMEAIELYRKANRNAEAARLLQQLGKEVNEKLGPVIMKKLYVLSALEVESYKKRMYDTQMTGATTAQTLESIITSDISTMGDKTLDNPWRGAEAYHFYILLQRQLYAGQFDAALRTALRLCEYENILETASIYSLLALTAYFSDYFKECSRAFVKLEYMSQSKTSNESSKQFSDLAVGIFSKHAPQDKKTKVVQCPGKECDAQVPDFATNCKSCGSNFPACVASGRPIFEKNYYTCKQCKHRSINSELKRLDLKTCPLCHAKINT